jgi:ABC-type Mn2+/Zn2+ transport system ATPase subunit
VTNNDRHELRKQVGYVAQAANIDPRMPMSVREVAMIGRYGILGLFHRPGKQDWNIVDEALEMVGMSHLANRPIGHLSGGEQQRAAIARALFNNPSVVLADEPTGNLDEHTGEGITELLWNLNATDHITLIVVTHDEQIAARAHRWAHLHEGAAFMRKG